MSRSLIPAIIPESVTYLRDTLSRIAPVTDEVQIDIVDGVFVPFVSWPYTEPSFSQAHISDTLHACGEDFSFELDLMINEPERVIEAYCADTVRRIVVHLESVHSLESLYTHRDKHSYKLGLSIGNNTSLSELTRHIDRVDFVQLMGIADIGSQGQGFDERVLARVRTLKLEFPDLEVSVDGSVNLETIDRLKDVGVDRFVSGSALLKADDLSEVYTELLKHIS